MELKEEGWLLIPRQGRKKPWMVRRCTKDLRSKNYHLQGGARHFKTKTNAENFIQREQQSDMKETEKRIGRLSAGARTPGQKAQDKARNEAIRKWFPDTIALQEKRVHGVRSQKQRQMIRKALAADLARLEHSIPKDILKGDPDFINTLVEAKEKANPFNPVVEELALNWLAHYSEDLPNEYGDKIRKKLKCEDSDAAIKGRVYRMGFRVAEQYQKPKSKP